MCVMETYERIRKLRKTYLHLSQTEFGKCLGVSRSVIKNLELNALARPEQKLSLIKLMCKEFKVNEEWLLNGIEPMFIEPETFSLDEFVKSKGASELELDILKTYFELDPDIREQVVEHFKKRLADRSLFSANSSNENTDAEIAKEVVPDPSTIQVVDRDEEEEKLIARGVELMREQFKLEKKREA